MESAYSHDKYFLEMLRERINGNHTQWGEGRRMGCNIEFCQNLRSQVAGATNLKCSYGLQNPKTIQTECIQHRPAGRGHVA